METATLPNKHLPNLPQQRRGIERFEAILDHAEPLLSGEQGAEASIYDIAEVTGLPTRSVYRLFPSMAAVRFALGQRYMNEIAQMVENLDYSTCASWQEAAELGLLEGRRYYEFHPFALELILGSTAVQSIRTADKANNTRVAKSLLSLQTVFYMPGDVEQLMPHLEIGLDLSDAVWVRSVHQHGRITNFYFRESVRALCSYLELYVPRLRPNSP